MIILYICDNLTIILELVSCKKSNLWYDAMKDEMNSIQSNKVWNLVEFPNGAKDIGCKWVFKTKRDSFTRQDSLLRDLLKKNESTTQRLFLMFLRKILFVLYWH